MISMITLSAAYASPTINSGIIQRFDENQTSEQLRDITITESNSEPVITEGELRITLPDSIEVLFNISLSEGVLLSGTAVDSGKIDASPVYSWDDGDKSIVFPVLEDFEAGEYVVIKNLFVEGFNSPSSASDHILLTVSGSDESYEDEYTLSISSSTIEDTREPDLPSDISIISTESGVEITWSDPTDLDLDAIEILRGLSPGPVDGNYYARVLAGEEYYIDTAVEEGDELTYILRTFDGQNTSENSESFTVTYNVPVEEEIVEEEEEVIEEEEEVVEEEVVEEEEEEVIVVTVDFDDLDGHWGEDAVEELAAESIVEGDPDGSFRPDDSLNRAEAATLMARVMYEWVEFEALAADYESPFSDLSDEDWYFEDVINLYSYGAVDGNPDGTFAPANNINRAEFLQLAVNLYEALNEELYSDDVSTDYFSDIVSSDWYYRAVAVAANEGWVQGSECDGEACFMPANEITRAEAAQILHNIFYGSLVE